jgi:hypothetical protein
MSTVTSLILSLALLVGGAGAVAAFESAAGSGSALPSASAPTETVRAAATGHRPHRHRTLVRWAPCRDGARLEGGACVTDVVRTVTLPASATAANGSAGGAASSSNASSGHGEPGDDGGGERGERGEHDRAGDD